MATQKRSGFTIIEVILFLAITSALTIGILVGSSVVIGQQRYRDSVNSFKGLVQQQYNHVANVISSDQTNPECNRENDTIVFNETEGSRRTRGTSECLILGRFMLIEPTRVTTYNLVGQPGTGGDNASDSAVLAGYSLSLRAPEVSDISWGAQIVSPPDESSPMTTSMLIVRSPISGSMLTYIQEGIDRTGSVREMISDSNMIEKVFCVDSGGLRSRLGVRINARASNQSAVEIPLEEERVCG